jgi:DNA-binding PadR family transcriptional regulator
MKIPFYILGLLLRYGPQHGYRLKQIIEERIADFAKIKLPTIYYHLEKLKKKGYVTETIERDGNRPEKMVYEITPDGQKYFNELLTKQLNEGYTPEFAIDGILFFRERTNHQLLQENLKSQINAIQIKLQTLKRHQSNTLSNIHEQGRFSAEAIFAHHRLHLEAELCWLKQTLEGLPE